MFMTPLGCFISTKIRFGVWEDRAAALLVVFTSQQAKLAQGGDQLYFPWVLEAGKVVTLLVCLCWRSLPDVGSHLHSWRLVWWRGVASVSFSKLGSSFCQCLYFRPSSKQKTPESRNILGFWTPSAELTVLWSVWDAHLSPAAVFADHVCVGHGGEERVRLQVVRQAGQELSDVDEVHLQQDVLVQPQDAETRPEQTLLPVPTEDVPNTTRHVQREGLTVQSEDPGQKQVKTHHHFK